MIALFNRQKQYEEPDNPDEGPVETAQIQIPMLKESKDKQFIESILEKLQRDTTELSKAGENFKSQLKRIVSLCKSRPKTLKTFMNTKGVEDADIDRRCDCFISCLCVTLCGDDNVYEKRYCLGEQRNAA